MILNKLKTIFDGNEEVDLSRRRVIKSAAALAALTVMPSIVANLVSDAKANEIQNQIASGRVYGQTFYITETVVIDIPNVVIDKCKFITIKPLDVMIRIGSNATNFIVKNCFLENIHGTGIEVLPQFGDMTTALQSAVDLASASNEVTVYLAKGDFHIGQPLTNMGF